MEKLIHWVHTQAGAVTIVRTTQCVASGSPYGKNFVPYLLLLPIWISLVLTLVVWSVCFQLHGFIR